MLHRFYNNDSIIHHNADGQHKAEHCERIDRESQREKEREGPDNGNRNREERNQGCTPALEKKEDDQHDKGKGFKQRSDDFVDRHFYYRNGFEGYYIVNVFGKGFLQGLHCLVHALCNIQRIASGSLIDKQIRSAFAIDERVTGVAEFSQLDASDVVQVDERTLPGICPDNNIAKLLLGTQATVGEHGILKGLGIPLRRRTDRACSNLEILF